MYFVENCWFIKEFSRFKSCFQHSLTLNLLANIPRAFNAVNSSCLSHLDTLNNFEQGQNIFLLLCFIQEH
jgi:hypothetical protein